MKNKEAGVRVNKERRKAKFFTTEDTEKHGETLFFVRTKNYKYCF
ncbi:MAG: hypothetical protein Q7I97_03710 [Thermovirgaceae bacterium]|nr:hypothetical protein [Thermovirgaceae bacterium]